MSIQRNKYIVVPHIKIKLKKVDNPLKTDYIISVPEKEPATGGGGGGL